MTMQENEKKKRVTKRKKHAQLGAKKQKYFIKKPKFSNIIFSRLAVGLGIAIIICLLGTVVANKINTKYMQSELTSMVNQAFESLREDYEKVRKLDKSEEEEKELLNARYRFRLNNLFSSFNSEHILANDYIGVKNTAYVLYDADTKKELVRCKYTANAIVSRYVDGEKQNSTIYECPRETIQDYWLEYDKLWDEYFGDSELPDISLNGKYSDITHEMLDLYIKGGEFLPGKLKILGVKEDGDYDILKEYDFTPQDTSLYEHIEVKENENIKVMGPFGYPVEEDEKTTKLLDEYMKTRDDEFIKGRNIDKDGNVVYVKVNYTEEEVQNNMKNIINEWIKHVNFFEDYAYCERGDEIGEGHEIYIAVVTQTNLLTLYPKKMVCIYIAILIMAVLLSFILSYHTYITRRSHYELDEYRRQTTNTMAHDLKTPLMAISGYAENLRNNVHNEKKDYYADAILQNITYMNDMIGNVLELAKVENTERILKKEPVELQTVTNSILQQYEILLQNKHLIVNIEGTHTILADAKQITQALDNLIGNAIKYASEAAIIQITITPKYYAISNHFDNTIEVPVEELWKPFVKGDNSRSEQKGNGIGLTIVANIARIHGMQLCLESENQEFIARLEY